METEASTIDIKGTNLQQVCAIKTTNRQALVTYIDSMLECCPRDNPDADYLMVSLGGPDIGHPECVARYKAKGDVPSKSVPCCCGNPKHWLLKYEQE